MATMWSLRSQMMTWVTVLVALGLSSKLCWCIPLITTSPQSKTVTEGSTVVLLCQTQDSGSRKVDWIFVEHNTQISHGTTLLVSSSSDKYSFILPQDVALTQINLQIKNIRKADHGHYRCLIEGTQASVTHQLTVIGAPMVPNITITPRNFTDCCIQHNVSSSCLPSCNPATLNRTAFAPLIACAFDLNKLLICGSDSRNHAGCCRRRGLPDICYDFCANNPPSLTDDHLICLNRTDEIIECYEEGQVLLPGPPVDVSALSLTSSSILVNWKPPLKNPNKVTGYRIAHKQSNAETDQYFSSDIRPATDRQYIISSLPSNVRYTIYVTAVGAHGSSQPSTKIDIATVQDNPGSGQDQDIEECCKKRKVTLRCENMCKASTWKTIDPDVLLPCYSELDNIYHCLAGGRNHTGCCQRNNVPAHCSDSLCSGKPPSLDWSFATCALNLPVIEACVKTGLSSLPSAPQSVTMGKVTSNSAELSWSPPTSGTAGVTYFVQIKEKDSDLYFTTKDEVTSTYIKLTGLKPSTEYEVRVVTKENDKSSLPSEIVIFLTYTPDINVTPEPPSPIALIHNVKECCIKQNVTEFCRAGCAYNISLVTSFFSNSWLRCLNDLEKEIACGSDGRDHSVCCKQNGVGKNCLDLCSYSEHSKGFGFDKAGCVLHLQPILQCYKEGVVYLPKHPQGLHTTNITANTISLVWRHPNKGPVIKDYIVRYTNKPGVLNWTEVKTSYTTCILQNLKPRKLYFIEVLSMNANGTSPPSVRLWVYTKSIEPIPRPTVNGTVVSGRVAWANRSSCCDNNRLRPECRPLCLNNATGKTATCYEDIDVILACASDGQDHRFCCQKRGVPKSCVPLCEGRTMGRNIITSACLTYTTVITTCFLEGAGLIPSQPRNFDVIEVVYQALNLTWDMPTDNCNITSGGCTFDVHYYKVSPYWFAARLSKKVTTVENVASPYILRGLEVFEQYAVTVSARNKYGGSQPAPAHSIFIEYNGVRDVSIGPVPEGIVDQGKDVKLICDAIASIKPEYQWKFNKQNRTRNQEYLIKSVKEADSGIYSCTADNGKGSKTATYFLNIRFKPKVTVLRDAIVEPYKALTAVLACNFQGHPDTDKIYWTKNGKRLRAIPFRVREYREERLHTGFTVARLKIANVIPSDYGVYRCNGSNNYGFAVGAVQLQGTRNATKPVTPGKAVANVTACCMQNKVEQDCMPICTFDVDVSKIVQNPKLFKCVRYLPTFSKCAADGRNHSQCCVSQAVIPFCLPFCSGVSPAEIGNSKLLDCVNHADTIMNCMVKGHDNIPSKPTKLQAKIINGAISIHWEPPLKNAHKVTYYKVFFDAVGKSVQYHSVSSTILSYSIRNIEPHQTYHVWVVAANDFGTSHRSETKNLDVKGIRPLAPTNLYHKPLTDTTIRLRWNPADSGPPADNYEIYYRRVDDKDYINMPTLSLSLRLENLDPGTKYEAYVVAHNKDGMSDHSNTIYFTTGGEPQKQSGGPSLQTVGLGVGLTLAIIVLIAVILAAVFILRMRRKKASMSTESVSFENPSYGSRQVQISGLHADTMQPSGQFAYGKLNEDATDFKKNQTLPEQTYTEIMPGQDGHLEVNGNNPATLSVDHVQVQSQGHVVNSQA